MGTNKCDFNLQTLKSATPEHFTMRRKERTKVHQLIKLIHILSICAKNEKNEGKIFNESTVDDAIATFSPELLSTATQIVIFCGNITL